MNKLYIFLSILSLSIISCRNEVIKSKKNESNDSISNVAKIILPTNNSPGKMINIPEACGYDKIIKELNIELFLPEPREVDEIKKILSFSGIPLNFEIYKANINNAAALVYENKRFIIYDSALLQFTDKNSNTYWTSISILAHEIGHHLSGHTLTNNIANHDRELQADEFSGFILYKMGATQEQAMLAMNMLGSEGDSKSHPAKHKRLAAINKGWLEASKQRYQGALPPPPHDSPNDFYKFTYKMLIDSELIKRAEELEYTWYDDDYKFLYGIITEADLDKDFFNIRILKTSPEFENHFRKIENEDWEINLSSVHFGGNNEMCHACEGNFKALIIPGRRLKFAMVESCPDCGTSMNGVWFLTYAEAIKNF